VYFILQIIKNQNKAL